MSGVLQHATRSAGANVQKMGLLTDLIARDGSRCVWCGRELWPSDLTAEHLLPRSRRGHATADNLAVACRRCNRARGTQAVSTYVRAQQDAGAQPHVDTLLSALDRLSRSPRRAHAQYGARQRELLLRMLAGDAQRRPRRSRTLTETSAPTMTRPSTTAPASPICDRT